jgi:uncharacterized protein
MRRRDFLLTTGAAAAWTALAARPVLARTKKAKVLYFTRGAFEHEPVQRRGGKLALSERIITEWGAEAGFDVDCSKDGRVFDRDLGQYDLFAFYTCNNLCEPDGHGNPPMSAEGLKRFLDAIAGGKGFVGFHSAADTFHSGRGDQVQKHPHPYVAMMGGEFISHGHQQDSLLPVTAPQFPGVKGMGKGLKFLDEWYSLKNFPDDLHVILMQETKGMTDWCYERPPYPATWARMHEKGRVFYTSFGHRDDIWTNPLVKALALGGIAWSLGRVDADLTPNLRAVAPHADVLPKFPPPAPPKKAKR